MVVTKNGEGLGPLTPEEILEFDSLYKEFLQDSVDLNDSSSRSIDCIRHWMQKALEYNVQKGDGDSDNFRRYLFPMAYKSFVPNPTKENMRLAFLLGWVLEMYHASGFIAVDFMDNVNTRDGKASWNHFEGIGPFSVNDSLMLRLGYLRLFTKYCGDKPYYPKMYNLMRESSEKWTIGRILNQRCIKQNSLSMERYANIMKCKSTANILSLPINLAIIMAGKDGDADEDSFKQLNQVLIDIGQYLQVKEDFGEVFGFDATAVKRLVDHIRTGWVSKEWSWLMVQAAQKCTPEKFQELLEMRKSTDAENLKILRNELEQCEVKDEYCRYQNECFGGIMREIEEMPDGDHKKFLVSLVSDKKQLES